MTARITNTFQKLKGRPAFVAYMMAGDPHLTASRELLSGLPGAGADIVELGMPFTDPAADGPSIEAAGLRSLAAGTVLRDVFDLVRAFRDADADTPVVLMGYCNPVHHMGYGAFADAMAEAGADGAIIVDLPPEEDAELREAFARHDLALIRLATPTTDAERLPTVVSGTKGFVYYVSSTGVTGGGRARVSDHLEGEVARVREASGLPVVVGFGIRTPERAEEVGHVADGVVVGSAIVEAMHGGGVEAALTLTRELSEATRRARD